MIVKEDQATCWTRCGRLSPGTATTFPWTVFTSECLNVVSPSTSHLTGRVSITLPRAPFFNVMIWLICQESQVAKSLSLSMLLTFLFLLLFSLSFVAYLFLSIRSSQVFWSLSHNDHHHQQSQICTGPPMPASGLWSSPQGSPSSASPTFSGSKISPRSPQKIITDKQLLSRWSQNCWTIKTSSVCTTLVVR